MNCPSCGHENIEGDDRCENCLAPFRQLDIPSVAAAEGLARSVMADNLSELDYDETICVAPDMPALEVARLMKNSNGGCALVVDDGKLIGIFTEHDVLLQMTGQVTAAKAPFVEPQIVEQTGSAANKAAALAAEIPLKAVPLMEVNETEAPAHDFQPHPQSVNQPRHTMQAPVKQLMTPNPEVLKETDSVAEALNKMSLGRYRHLPFVKSDGTYGVASISSVLRYIAQEDW